MRRSSPVRVLSKYTDAVRVAKLTLALSTPSVLPSCRSTVRAQAAQVIPADWDFDLFNDLHVDEAWKPICSTAPISCPGCYSRVVKGHRRLTGGEIHRGRFHAGNTGELLFNAADAALARHALDFQFHGFLCHIVS